MEDNHMRGQRQSLALIFLVNCVIIKNTVEGTTSGSGNNYSGTGAQIVGPFITTTGTISSSNPVGQLFSL